MEKRVIVGATGFIGRALAERWRSRHIRVVALGRSLEKINAIFGDGVECVTWDQMARDVQAVFNGVSVIVNLSGAGIADALWTTRRKEIILKSRIESTQKIAAICAHSAPACRVLLNASAIGIYGAHQSKGEFAPPVFDESSASKDQAPSFLAYVCREWEKATREAQTGGMRVVHMRLGHVIAPQGGLLAKMVVPFKIGLGPIIGSGNQVISWISLDDLCHVIDFLIDHEDISGPVNCVSPSPVTQKEFAQTLARVLRRPCFLSLPGWLLRAIAGSMADELFLGGQRVLPKKLTDHGFGFSDLSIIETLQNSLREQIK